MNTIPVVLNRETDLADLNKCHMAVQPCERSHSKALCREKVTSIAIICMKYHGKVC